MTEDYYLILGVDVGADARQVEAAYRRRVREIEAGDEASWPLPVVQEAFSVLSDPHHRQSYDQSFHKVPTRAGISSPKARPEPLIPPRRASHIGNVSLTQSFRTFRPSFEEVFERLWSNFTQKVPPKSESVKSLTIEIPITPQQAMTGGTARVLVPALVVCPVCHGRGHVGSMSCIHCDGRGAIVDEYPVMVSFPAGRPGFTRQIALDQLGIHNFYLTVHFRITQGQPE